MTNFLKNYKWKVAWSLLTIILISYSCGSFCFINKTWHSDWLQVGGIILTLSATILIMLMNNEKIDKATFLQLEEMRAGNERQIKEIQKQQQTTSLQSRKELLLKQST